MCVCVCVRTCVCLHAFTQAHLDTHMHTLNYRCNLNPINILLKEKELKMTEDKLDTDSLRTEIKELTSEKGCLDSKLKRLE